MRLNIYASHHRYPSLPFSLYRLFIASKLMSSERTIFSLLQWDPKTYYYPWPLHPYQTMENVIISTHFFSLVFFFFQLGMFFHLYKTYNVMPNRLARKPTYHLIWQWLLPTKALLFLITKHPGTVYSMHYQNNYKVSKEFESHTKS